MVDINMIHTTSEVFNLYLKQKSEFHFQQKTDNDFVMFLLDTAVRVISIVQHLSPVIEAVSDASDTKLLPDIMDIRDDRDDDFNPSSKRPCLREPIMGLSLDGNTDISTDLIDQQISHHSSEFQQLEKELETLTQSLCNEVAMNSVVMNHNIPCPHTAPPLPAPMIVCPPPPPTITVCPPAVPMSVCPPLQTAAPLSMAVGPPSAAPLPLVPEVTPAPLSMSPPVSSPASSNKDLDPATSISDSLSAALVFGGMVLPDATSFRSLAAAAIEDKSGDLIEHAVKMEVITPARTATELGHNTKEKKCEGLGEEVKIKLELHEQDEENNRNSTNNMSTPGMNSVNSMNNNINMMMTGSTATNQDSERLATAVLHSVNNLNSVSNFLGSLSQLSLPGPSTQVLPPSMSGCKTFDCSFCEFTTLDKMEYVKHIRDHTGEKPYTCQICDYKSDHRGNLVIHMRTHTQGRLYHCKLCSFRTSRRMYLHEHMESHAVEEKPYVCLLCDYRTARKANLGIHMGSQKHIASVMKAKSMRVGIDNKTEPV